MSRGRCPNCAARSIDVLVEIPRTPVHQHITFASADGARRCARGDMALALSQRCGFVFNAAFEPALLRYSPIYDNSQEHSPAFEMCRAPVTPSFRQLDCKRWGRKRPRRERQLRRRGPPDAARAWRVRRCGRARLGA